MNASAPASSAPSSTTEPLLQVRDLHVTYRARRRVVHAVGGVDFEVRAGETVGIVGESGSGKSTLGKAVLGLVPVSSGTIRFAGTDVTHASARQRRMFATDLQVVFQDPYSSLNPTRTIGQALAEPLTVSGRTSDADVAARVRAALQSIRMTPDAADRYPSQFSGGQRQRIAIARAVINHPRLIVCDEPVSALDLSVQAQVLNLLHDLQRDNDLAMLFISHDLAVVKHVAERIIVFNRGTIVEQGAAADVYAHPQHAYTRALLDASPVPDPIRQRNRRRDRRAQSHASSAGVQVARA